MVILACHKLCFEPLWSPHLREVVRVDGGEGGVQGAVGGGQWLDVGQEV